MYQPRTYLVPTSYLPRTYLVPTSYLPRTCFVPTSYQPRAYLVTFTTTTVILIKWYLYVKKHATWNQLVLLIELVKRATKNSTLSE